LYGTVPLLTRYSLKVASLLEWNQAYRQVIGRRAQNNSEEL